MNAPAALLYRQNLAWQSPRVTENDRASQAVDPPKPETKPEEPFWKSFNPTWITAAFAALTFGIVGFNQCTSPLTALNEKVDALKTDNAEIKTSLVGVQKDISVLQNWVRRQDPAFPGGSATARSLAPPAPVPSAVPSTGPAPVASTAPIKTLPSGAPVIPTPVCVSPKTQRRFPCEEASACHPESAYNPNFFAALKKSANAEAIVVCDRK